MKELVEETKIYNIPEILPVLPIKGGVIFPNLISPLIISTIRSAKLVDETLAGDKLVLCVSQKNPDIEEAQPEDLYSVGTVVLISKMLRFPDGTMRLLVQGLKRAKVINFTQQEPYLKAKAETVEENDKKDISVEALMRNVVNLFHQLADMAPYLPEDMTTVVMNIESPGRLADFVASYTNFDIADKQNLLEILDPKERLSRLAPLLTKEISILELGAKIRDQVKGELDKSQREYYLREQMKAIQKELGEMDERSAEINTKPIILTFKSVSGFISSIFLFT